MRITPQEYRALRLEVHEILRDVPLRDVSVVDLPGGGQGRTVGDVHSLLAANELMGSSAAVSA